MHVFSMDGRRKLKVRSIIAHNLDSHLLQLFFLCSRIITNDKSGSASVIKYNKVSLSQGLDY